MVANAKSRKIPLRFAVDQIGSAFTASTALSSSTSAPFISRALTLLHYYPQSSCRNESSSMEIIIWIAAALRRAQHILPTYPEPFVRPVGARDESRSSIKSKHKWERHVIAGEWKINTKINIVVSMDIHYINLIRFVVAFYALLVLYCFCWQVVPSPLRRMNGESACV